MARAATAGELTYLWRHQHSCNQLFRPGYSHSSSSDHEWGGHARHLLHHTRRNHVWNNSWRNKDCLRASFPDQHEKQSLGQDSSQEHAFNSRSKEKDYTVWDNHDVFEGITTGIDKKDATKPADDTTKKSGTGKNDDDQFSMDIWMAVVFFSRNYFTLLTLDHRENGVTWDYIFPFYCSLLSLQA